MAKKAESKKISIKKDKLNSIFTVINTVLIVLLFFWAANISATLSDLSGKETVNNGAQVTPPTQTQPAQQVQKIEVGTNPVKGNKNAKVTIVEFSDFECPYCGRAFPTVKQIEETYGNKIALYFRNFPLSFHPDAQKAAEAAECAQEQGKFWEMHDKLFGNQQALGVDKLKSYAKDLGLDTTKFNDCLDSGKTASTIQNDFVAGKNYGVSGTPTFFINGQKVVGAQPFSAFKQVIDTALAK